MYKEKLCDAAIYKDEKEFLVEEIGMQLYKIGKTNLKDLLEIINLYYEVAEIDKEAALCSEDGIEEIFEDSLYKYFENLHHVEEGKFDLSEKFLVRENGWWTTTNDEDDLVDQKVLAEFIYDHQEYFDEVLDYDQLYDALQQAKEDGEIEGYEKLDEEEED